MISSAPRRRRGARAALAVLALAALTGCTRDVSDLRPVLDLVAELPAAETYREVDEIDVGSPSASRHLVWGWSWNEREPAEDGGETTYAWGVDGGSIVRFYLVNRRDLRLALRGRAGPPVPAGSQVVSVTLNGKPVERLTLQPQAAGWRDYPVAVPRDVLQTGWNTLELGYEHAVEPRDAGLSGDRRALAVAWDRIRLEPAGPADGPEPGAIPPGGTGEDGGRSGEAGALRLPLGTEVVYYAELPAGSLLACDELRASGVDSRLVVRLQWEGEDAVDLASLHPSDRLRALDLVGSPSEPAAAASERRLARLSLRAVPAGWLEGRDAQAEGALTVVAPRVLAPEPADEGAEEAPAAPASRASREPTAAAARPNVLVYLIDTLRADRVGAFSPAAAKRRLTPAIDSFARGAVVFEDALTQAPWTRPAVASLLTGLPPLAHGVTTLESRLPGAALTLPEVLRDLPDGGYRTAAWSTNWHVIRKTGLAQGFEDFHFFPAGPRPAVVNRSVVAWLDRYLEEGRQRPGELRQPFFLYVHALDPHAPYRPPADLWRRFAPGVTDPDAGTREYLGRVYGASGAERKRLMAALPPLYDAEVALADRGFGQLLRALEARGLRDDTLVVLLSDHGEEFDEHGNLGHGADLFHEVLRVPLIVDLPGREPGRVAGTALPMDVPATVLAALGVAKPAAMDGRDLFAGERGRSGGADRPAFAHLDYERRAGVSVVLGRWKLIEPLTHRFAAGPQLYDLGRDPGERENLAESHPVRAGYLRMLVRRHLLATGGGGAPGERADLDPEARAGLEALGYL